MTLSSQTVKQLFAGTGAQVDFAIPFPYYDTGDVQVWRRDETVPTAITETLMIEGVSSDFQFTGGDPVNGVPPTTVTFNTAPLVTHKILIKRFVPLVQDVDYVNVQRFPIEDHEEHEDRATMADLQIQEQLDRSLHIRKTDSASIASELIYVPGGILKAKDDGSGFEMKDAASILAAVGGGSGVIGVPTDTIFGASGGVAGLDPADIVADGFDKVEVILEKLIPAKPANLSTKTLAIAGAYSAKAAGTGTLDANCIDSTQPTATATGFYNGDAGTLTDQIDGAADGSIAITIGNNTGLTSGGLTVTADVDPYAGIPGQQNFWKQLSASIRAALALSIASHTYQMTHSQSGSTPLLTFFVDDPVTPSIASTSASSTGTSHNVSGVPGLAQGQNITVGWTVNNAVKSHYNATQVGSVTSGFTNSVGNLMPGSTPANGDPVVFSQAIAVAASKYTENFQASVSGYNSKGGSASTTVTPATVIRIDTISDESARKTSGIGQFPSSGYNGAFNTATALTTAGNEELQVLGGVYQFPPAVNYSGVYPAGPNYSAITGGSFSNYRWATFDTGAVAALSACNINLIGSSGIASILQAGMILQVKVEGVTGWIDANAAYPGVGSPSADGDPAVVVGSSTATSRRVTFGSTPRTGNLLVRVGFPSGSTKTFTGITRT